MDRIQREKVLEKLGKIKALAERGVGGEKETAMRMYEELCRKYNISDDEAEAALMKLETRWFSYSTPLRSAFSLLYRRKAYLPGYPGGHPGCTGGTGR